MTSGLDKTAAKSTLAVSFLFALSLAAGESSLTRVQVIAPSTPIVDTYTPVTLVARTPSREIDRSFTGDIWLWTDGPWIRPFHVAFTPQDQGVIKLPLRFSLPVLQRIETYTPGGQHHTWSNPVMAQEEGDQAKRLFWGRMGECQEPGLDFCLSGDGSGKNHDLTGLKTIFPMFFAMGELRAMMPNEEGLIGVWAEDNDRDSLWSAIQKGEAYASWGSRIIIDCEWNAPRTPEKKDSIKVRVAGEGPVEEVSIWKQEGRNLKKIFHKQTDNYHLEFESDGVGSQGTYFIIVTEPGSARKSLAIQGPIKIFP